MRFLIFRVVVPLLLIFLLRSVLRSLFEGLRSKPDSAVTRPEPPPVPAGGELKRDPVCGTYVSTAGSITRSVRGQLVYFCSKECRDKYRIA